MVSILHRKWAMSQFVDQPGNQVISNKAGNTANGWAQAIIDEVRCWFALSPFSHKQPDNGCGKPGIFNPSV